MNILLVCSAGMSTSLLVNRMQKEAEVRSLKDIKVFAASIEELELYIDEYDVVLIGPQLRYREKHVSALAGAKGKSCAVIDSLSYGMVDGKKVLEHALSFKK
jgi:PTS system cellobiose-specific IIB component